MYSKQGLFPFKSHSNSLRTVKILFFYLCFLSPTSRTCYARWDKCENFTFSYIEEKENQQPWGLSMSMSISTLYFPCYAETVL